MSSTMYHITATECDPQRDKGEVHPACTLNVRQIAFAPGALWLKKLRCAGAQCEPTALWHTVQSVCRLSSEHCPPPR